MQKLPGVETVDVSLTKASTDIRFRSGNTVTLAQLRDVIKKGGFKSGETQIVATGTLVNDKNRVTLDLAPAKMTLIVESDPASPAAYAEARKAGGRSTRHGRSNWNHHAGRSVLREKHHAQERYPCLQP